jgi:hypothetical protein
MSVGDRAKHQIALYGRTVAVVFLLVGLLAIGGAVYIYLTPGVEQIPPQQTDVRDFETSVEHSAIVVNGTELYDEGQRLENQPRYFFGPTPILNLSAVAVVPDDRPVAVSHRLAIVIQAIADDQPLFERRRILVADEATVEDGRLAVNATMNATAVLQERNEIQNEIGTLGSVSTQLVLQTSYETESTQGDTYAGNLTTSSTVNFADQGYWLSGNLSASTTESTTVGGGVREQDPNMALVGGLGALGLIAVVLSGVFTYWSSRKVDIEELKMQIDRAQFSEWISEGDFPSGQNRQYVYIESLEDLVDVAIDVNKRVIYDPEIETYAVPDGDIVYYHAVDPQAVSSWLDLS